MERFSRLFSPGSIAVVGGGSWCAAVVSQCRDSGFDGPVWPVHPSRPEVEGLPAYPSVAALPGVPDAAFIGVNREKTIDVVGHLSVLGCGGAVCFANGYAEAIVELHDGADLQARLVEATGAMRILGPNCYGFVNMLEGVALWPDRHGMVALDSGVAILGQSSNVLLNLTMQRRGLPLAVAVAVGNQAQTSMAALGIDLLEDPRITAVGLHIEGISDLPALEQLSARARALGKPVVALKVGQSHNARSAAVSHTAALVGSNAGARALFARLGIAQVDSAVELIEALKLCHVTGGLTGATVASASCSGGEASLMADLGAAAGLAFPPLDPAQRQALQAVLGPRVALANPLDYNTHIWGNRAALVACFSALAQSDQALTCVVLDMPRTDRFSALDFEQVVEAVIETRRLTGKPMAVVSLLPEGLPEDYCARLIAAGVTPLCGMSEALRAIRAAATAGTRGAVQTAPLLRPRGNVETRVFDEAEAKALLSAAGLRVPRAQIAATAQAAAACAEQIGFPVVLKGTGLAHKTEEGAVVLGIASAAAVEVTARAMGCTRFLVEEMITDNLAELLVSITHDPAHGFVLTVGMGGILTELVGDTWSLLLPVSRDEIRTALAGLRTGAVLTGYRGRPAADIEAVLDSVMLLQSFVEARSGSLEEIEINPLICGTSGAIVADALIRMGDPA
ncbi:acyl-CoA synthetase [Pseudooceanicola lipolyticus]|uniref:Acyl-CoA synthetase n=1 Tax=Pseudooceanicola lipolyticus TaxID=2029104 RepID=A0A2M8J5K0_9RHOB|nr:acetate--CoA ligase family protein [Pseudooceanicola lipolyticus]PJE38053.1 acyl-CoA synthetase [Pseudooceanicola lipolyticus]